MTRQNDTLISTQPLVEGCPRQTQAVVIAAVADDFLAWGWADKQLGRYVVGHSESSFKELRQHVVNLLCELTGGSRA
jgi:hypothetical protein